LGLICIILPKRWEVRGIWPIVAIGQFDFGS